MTRIQRSHVSSLALGVALLATGLGGCNTIRGASEDVQAGGAAVEEAARDTQNSIQSSAAEREAQKERDRVAAEAEAARLASAR